jgi:hypothetical protein
MQRMMLAAVLLFLPAVALAQFQPYAPPVPGLPDARARRAARERAVAYAGASSRHFVETYGEPAVWAIFGCSQGAAGELVEFSNSGGLAKLPRPAALLQVIAQRGHGDDVLRYAIDHATELTDGDHFNAYLQSPLEYACALRDLAQGAAEARARRLAGEAAAARWQVRLDGRTLALGGSILALGALLLWWKYHRRLT